MKSRKNLPISKEENAEKDNNCCEKCNDDKNLLIQKANPLLSLSESKMSLVEFKLLDAYLSHINTQDISSRYVRFERGELEKILGEHRIRSKDLEDRLNDLFCVVTIRDNRKPHGFCKIGLMSKAEAVPNDDGTWNIEMACTPEAMEYFFEPQKIGYFKYRLHNVVQLTSRYSYLMFLYLEQNLSYGQKKWKVSIEDLKTVLHCEQVETYKQYYRFNNLILQKITNEINQKCDIQYKYEPIRSGRKVTAIEIKITSYVPQYVSQINAGSIEEPDPVYLDDKTNSDNKKQKSSQAASIPKDHLAAYSSILQLCQCKFSSEEINTIAIAVEAKAEEHLPVEGSELTRRCLHLYRQVSTLNQQMQGNQRIVHPARYLCTLIDSNIDISLMSPVEMIEVGKVING